MATKLVIFDLDGVLVDSKEIWYGLWKKGFQSIGRDFNRETFEKVWGLPLQEGFEESGFSEKEQRAALDAARQGHMKMLDKLRLCPDVRRVFSALEEQGIKRALLTNNPKQVSEKITGMLGMSFDSIPDPVKVGYKPDPAGINTILDELGIERDRALFVGDTQTDERAGANAGIRTIIMGRDARRLGEVLEQV